MKAQIAGLGTVVIDQQIFMDKYPEWDTKNSMQDHRTQVGGPVPTALVFLSRLGHKCGFVGKWSDDFLDAGSPKSGLSDLIPLVDVMICPGGFAGLFFNNDDINKAALSLLEMGAGTVVFTSGENGSQLFSQGCHLTQEAFKVKAVDTNGAGDVFCGGLIHGLQSKLPRQEALRFASAAAALKCTRAGNRQALPELQEIKAMMESE